MRRLSLAAGGVALVVFLLPVPAVSGPGSLIQPGVMVNDNCTLNFVYDGVGVNAGRVFIGVAAHCVEAIGQSASTDAHPDFGEVAYIGDAAGTTSDFAFFEVYPALHASVSPEVKGHPGKPVGSTVFGETMLGDEVRFSGHGLVFAETQQTQEGRFGVLAADTAEEWWAYGPVLFGDSGGPVLHESGKALGIVTEITTSFACCGQETHAVVGAGGPTLEGILAKAAADGFPVALRTV